MPEKSGNPFHSLQFAKRPRRMVLDMSNDDKVAVEKLHSTYGRMKEELGRVIVGQEVVVEQALMEGVARGEREAEELLERDCSCEPCSSAASSSSRRGSDMGTRKIRGRYGA